MQHAWERIGMDIGFWWESLNERDPLRRPKRKWEDDTEMD
jgi:hypothetical protein